ncbi:similar to Saccharomyces cerevisiae YOR264W DSE3 Daughter cell-specific protein, may help establish daughter fate [Maudiozyma saulgeensis]|uniref:Similar to Saccharomyces cerevisiae YOR264W DSE3 Daughter cell-specific protein, may help establish daughter fate n=1 Tax=Maudiozyma saulgeensis TaxID=1789683 RepID=A0A1X7R4D4_9SACH|nr:similar to Saccharomyces cerevisiae YOR264W DSE3 Daughter cell-specific protein, may help establish daughter fate [Kazachstania saulgeensis]
MPRKFLGQKIERGVDVLRPPSLTLTAEELCMIPPIPSSSSEESLILHGMDNNTDKPQQKKLKRLSRQYGGTIYFKKRLESVPEIFLHDFKKRQNKDNDEHSKHIPAQLLSVERMPVIKETNLKRQNSIHNCKRVLQRNARCVSQSPAYRYCSERPTMVTSNLHRVQPPKVVIQSPEMPQSRPKRNNKNIKLDLHHPGCSRSTNEILFDEILDAYRADEDCRSIPSIDEEAISFNQNKTSVLNSEIERVLEHVQKRQNIVEMNKRIAPQDEDLVEDRSSNKNNSDTSSIESGSHHIKHLSDLISSHDESNGSSSDVWTEDDIDIVSSSSNTDGYETAQETIPSSLEIADLNIHDIPVTSQEERISTLSNSNTLKEVSCHKISIIPVMFHFDDEFEVSDTEGTDGDIQTGKMVTYNQIPSAHIVHSSISSSETSDIVDDLQAKIDRISIIDSDNTPSISSSIYS